MKAIIKTDGTLVITAENETEEYALKKWKEDEFKTDKQRIEIQLRFTPPWENVSHTARETIEAFTQ